MVPYKAERGVKKKRVKKPPNYLASLKEASLSLSSANEESAAMPARKREGELLEATSMNSKKKGAVIITPAFADDGAVNTAMDGAVASNTAGEQITRKEKIPPIVVSGLNEENYASLCSATQKGTINASFNFTAGNTCRINCVTRADHQAIKLELAKFQREYYSHDFKADKPYQVVLKGLRFGSEDHVSEMLRNLELLPSQVRELKVGESRGLSSKLFVVSFPKGATSLEELQKISHLNYTNVKWERFQPKQSEVMQCLNCLHFGHASKHCAMTPRCAKCAGNHRTRQCDKELGGEQTCANCQGNHSPYNRNCSTRILYLQKRNLTASTPKCFIPAPIPTRSSWEQPLNWVGQNHRPTGQHFCSCPGCPNRQQQVNRPQTHQQSQQKFQQQRQQQQQRCWGY